MEPSRSRRQAIVLGGSMAGLLAARVLSDHFEQVTLIERDRFPEGAEHRKGVPQGRHFHVLLKRGETALDRLFPDLGAALTEGGAPVVDIGADMRIYQFGDYKVRCSTEACLIFLSRPFLEWHVRRRVLSLKNVAACDEREVAGLVTNGDRTRVTGVMVRGAGRSGSPEGERLEADLIVDATGRGSQSGAWLEALGYSRPPETTMTIDVHYTSRVYRRTPVDLPGAKAAYALPKPPHERRFGALFPMEGERWIATLGAWLGDHAPANEAGFLQFARSLPAPDIARALPRLEPLADFVVHHFPANRRRHYERLARFPDGYIVLGDAMCSFNPVYGQGMTVSALEAHVLDECLRERNGGDVRGLPRRFFGRAAKMLDPAWRLTTSEDLRHPGVAEHGAAPPGTRVINWYTARIYEAAVHDAEVYRAFVQVLTMLRPPMSLFRPRLVFRTLTGALAQRLPLR